MISKIFALAFLVAAFVGFQHFHLADTLTLENLKSNHDTLVHWYTTQPVQTVAVYFLLYVVVTAVSLPGAAILTLAGGAIFGLVVGTVVVSFASTIGATLAFLLARFLFRDAVARKFRQTIETVDRGIRKEGAFYLFSLRLIPLFPFFAINLVMGLTAMRVGTFFFVSQAGMLLGTLAFVNAGTELGKLTSVREVLSLPIIASFVAVGALPLVAKMVLSGLRRRKTTGRFPRPKEYDYNVVVIGAGSGGLVASYIAATVRAKVALIEKSRMGGDCLNTGCVPSKALIRSAKVMSDARRAHDLGFERIDAKVDFAKVMERVQRIIKTIEPHDSVERYTGLGVDCLPGEARLLSPYEVQVGSQRLTTKNIILATGAEPFIPTIPGLKEHGYLTSDTVWSLRELPERLVVLGGGPVGAELAQSFARLGSKVTVVEKGERLLSREDDDVSSFVKALFESEGIELRFRSEPKRVVNEAGNKYLVCDQEGKETRVAFDQFLVALGRRARTQGFGLEELGVTLTEGGSIDTDDYLRTNFPNIFVCGDAAGPYQFTHVASHQAWYAAVNSLFGPFKMFRADYRVIPWTTFLDPEVARVGLSEKEAAEKGIEVEVTKYGLPDLDRAIVESEAKGFVKILTEKGSDKILGAVAIGPRAGDTMAELVLAMKHGIGLDKILGTIHTYPTFAESNKYAAGIWKKAHAPEKMLRLLEKFHAWRR